MSKTVFDQIAEGLKEVVLEVAQGQEDEWPPRDIQTVEDWLEACELGAFIDYDGSGEMLVQEGDTFIPHGPIWPSIRHTIPSHITHIEWFNK